MSFNNIQSKTAKQQILKNVIKIEEKYNEEISQTPNYSQKNLMNLVIDNSVNKKEKVTPEFTNVNKIYIENSDNQKIDERFDLLEKINHLNKRLDDNEKENEKMKCCTIL